MPPKPLGLTNGAQSDRGFECSLITLLPVEKKKKGDGSKNRRRVRRVFALITEANARTPQNRCSPRGGQCPESDDTVRCALT